MIQQITCECGCGRTFFPPSDAPHKRFFSTACRNRWHGRARLDALQRLDSLASERVHGGLASDLVEGRRQVMQLLSAVQQHGEG